MMRRDQPPKQALRHWHRTDKWFSSIQGNVQSYIHTGRRFPHGPLASELAPLVHRRTDGNALLMVNLVDHLA